MILPIGTFLLGCFVLLYWARVVRMAYRQRKRTGRAANFIPKEKLGKILRVIWNPVVGIWVIHPFINAFADDLPVLMQPKFDARIIALPGALVAGFCFVGTVFAWRKMGTSWRMGIDPNEKNELIVSGPFAYIRHPIYALSILMMLASMLVVPSTLMLSVGAIHIFLIVWEASREERHMLRQHGEVYEHYRDRVGAFFPISRTPYEGANGGSSPDPFGRGCETVPINIFQRMVRWFDRAHPYNAVHVIKLSREFDPQQIESAWNTALRALGLGRVHVRNRRYGFERLSETESAGLECHNGTTEIWKVIETEINRPFETATVPVRAFVVTTAEGQCIGLTYAHWIADATAIRLLLGEWISRLTGNCSSSAGAVHYPREGYLKLFSSKRANWDLLSGVLFLMRSFCRLRQAKKIDGRALNRLDVGVLLHPARQDLITALRLKSHLLQCTVNDIFLAALLETSAELVPLQHRRNRNDVAVGNIIDLRRYSSTDLRQTFGMFLGLTSVVARPADLKNWQKLLKCVIRQNNILRKSRMAPASILRLGLASVVSTLSNTSEMYHFFRKEAPLAGGISNVNLNETWVEQAWREKTVQHYYRASPTGPLVPLTLSLTTLDGQLQLAITYRKSLIDEPLAREIASKFVTRLEKVVAIDDSLQSEVK